MIGKNKLLSNCSNSKIAIPRLISDGRAVVPLTDIQRATLDQFISRIESSVYIEIPNPCFCGSTNDITVASKDRYGIPLQTILCKRCGSMRSDPYLTETCLSQFYDNEYRPLYVGTNTCTDEFFDEQQKFGENIYEFIKNHYGISDHSIVYEIGCGAGGILNFFKEKNCIVEGCDPTSEYVEFGRKKGLDLRIGGIETFKDHIKGDVIILNHVLEHITKPHLFLNQIREMMKEDGILFIALPGIFNIKKSYGDLAFFLQNAHVYHFTLTTLDYLLNSSGYARIHGDESIRAIYKKSDYKKINYDEANARDILEYLLSVERNRHLNILIIKSRLFLGKVKMYCENILA